MMVNQEEEEEQGRKGFTPFGTRVARRRVNVFIRDVSCPLFGINFEYYLGLTQVFNCTKHNESYNAVDCGEFR